MEVVCLESIAFYQLIDEVVERLMDKHQEKPRWISVGEAMSMLNITSKTTLQKLKSEGQIRFSQPMRKLTLFDRQSILDFLDKHAQEVF